MNGGGPASRGYFLQAIAAVLHSLEDKDWIAVTLGPTDELFHHKIDISWDYPSGRKKVAQVKSTENNFGKAQIVRVLKEVILNYQSAEEYLFILIGDCNKELEVFIKEINNKKDAIYKEENLRELISYKDKIKILKIDFDYDSLEGRVHNVLHKVMSSKSPVTYKAVKAQMNELFYIFQKTSCTKITRKELSEWLDSYTDLSLMDQSSLNYFAFGQLERYYSTSNESTLEEIDESFKELQNKWRWNNGK